MKHSFCLFCCNFCIFSCYCLFYFFYVCIFYLLFIYNIRISFLCFPVMFSFTFFSCFLTNLPFLLIHPHPQEGLFFFMYAFLILNFRAISIEALAPRRKNRVRSSPFREITEADPEHEAASADLLDHGGEGLSDGVQFLQKLASLHCGPLGHSVMLDDR